MRDIYARKQQLEDRKKALNWKLVEIEAALSTPGSRDSEERATEREDDELLENLGLNDQAEIRMIDAALGRIEAGTYGICAKCGSEVSPARLDILPATPFCKSCAGSA